MEKVDATISLFIFALRIYKIPVVFDNPEIANRLLYNYIDEGGFDNIKISEKHDPTQLRQAFCEIASKCLIEYMHEVKGEPLEALHIKSYANKLQNLYIMMKSMFKQSFPFKNAFSESNKIMVHDENMTDASVLINNLFIGVMFYKNDVNILKYSIEITRITHNSVEAYISSFIANMFISFAMTNKDPNKWIFKILRILEKTYIMEYLKYNPKELTDAYDKHIDGILDTLKRYIEIRFVNKKHKYDVTLSVPSNRIYMYEKILNISPIDFGANCLDTVIIAYDCFLDAAVHKKPSLEKLYVCSMLHTGMTEYTGALAFTLWGAYFGYNNVPEHVIKSYSDKKVTKQIMEIIG
jgi:ADP-ribosylglycohydrolase